MNNNTNNNTNNNNGEVKVTRKEFRFEILKRAKETRAQLKQEKRYYDIFLLFCEVYLPSWIKIAKATVLCGVLTIAVVNIICFYNIKPMTPSVQRAVADMSLNETPSTAVEMYDEAMKLIDNIDNKDDFSIEDKDAMAKEYIKETYGIDLP